MQKLEFFYYETCPFCLMVMKVIRKLNLDIQMIDIYSDQGGLERLEKDTGRRTTPCLYIDNTPMFESQDIMIWLETNHENLKKKVQ